MELKKEVESLLFSSGKEMSEEELAELTNNSKNNVRKALKALNKDYGERDSSLLLVNKGSSWKINVQEKYMNLVTKIVADTELSFPVLETLAVIAYNAPALQADVIKSRGTNAYEHIGLLVEEDFVEKRKEGRSYKLSLTPKFFKYFDVKGDKDIKEALKKAKQPQKKNGENKGGGQNKKDAVPEKVGGLDVVDVPPEEKRTKGPEGEVVKGKDGDVEKLGDLEVVDEPEEQEDEAQGGEEGSDETEEDPQGGQEDKQIFGEQKKRDTNHIDSGFLEDIDKQIDALSKKNDELDKDESLKRREDEEDNDDKNDDEYGEDNGVDGEELGEEQKDKNVMDEAEEATETEEEKGKEDAEEEQVKESQQD